MQLRIGYEFKYQFPQATPGLLNLNVHHTRVSDLLRPDVIRTTPTIPSTCFRDGFGNWCSRMVAPPGDVTITCETDIRDSGHEEVLATEAGQCLVERLPDETLEFLRASRFCESDELLDLSWRLFGHFKPGGARVQAICDYVHNHIRFDYTQARPTRTAVEAYQERVGVCRDFAHLAVAFCRALNIPARYCTGYLSDLGTDRPYPPGDFAAWFDAYLDAGWCTFDPRNNTPRAGRILMARGRDAADVAMITTFGPNKLVSFRVWADEIDERVPSV